KDVERPAGDAAQLCILDTRKAQAGSWIEHGKIKAKVFHPFIQEPRHHCRCPVAGILGRQRPKCLLCDAVSASLRYGHGEFLPPLGPEERKSFDGAVPSDFAELFADGRTELQPMSVRVDNGVIQTRMKPRCVHVTIATHE